MNSTDTIDTGAGSGRRLPPIPTIAFCATIAVLGFLFSSNAHTLASVIDDRDAALEMAMKTIENRDARIELLERESQEKVDKLKQDMEEFREAEVMQLMSMEDRLEKELQDATGREKALLSEIEQLSGALEMAAVEIEDVRTERMALLSSSTEEDELDDLRAQLASFADKNATLEVELKETSDLLNKKELELLVAKRTSSRFENEIERLTEIQGIVAGSVRRDTALSALLERIEVLEARNDFLEAQLERWRWAIPEQ
jgi:chromosome segregation ATPase